MMRPTAVCRLCKKASWQTPNEGLMRYAVRHWVHTSCGIERWGVLEFFAKLNPWQIRSLPALVLDRYPGALALAKQLSNKGGAQ